MRLHSKHAKLNTRKRLIKYNSAWNEGMQVERPKKDVCAARYFNHDFAVQSAVIGVTRWSWTPRTAVFGVQLEI